MNNAKVRSARRSFLMSVLSLILCFAMLLGTTFAWFTDSVTSGVNKIVAGNLDIEVSYKNTKSGSWNDLQNSESVFSQGLWEPGHTEFVNLKIENKGTLALKYKVLVTPVSESGGINALGENFKLSDYLKFGTTAASETEPAYTDRAAARADVTANAMGLAQAGLTQGGTMKAGDPAQYITLVVYMPETVGNEANYKTGTTAPEIDLGITVIATQDTVENDSFGNQYDKDASLSPVVEYNYFPQVNVTGQLEIDENAKISKGSEAAGTVNVTQLENDETKSKVVMSSSEQIEGTSAAKLETILEKAEGEHQTGSMTLKVVKDDTANASFKTDSTKINTATQDSTTYQVTVETKGVVAVPETEGKAKFKVDLFIGKNRTNVKMYHNGTEMTDTAPGANNTFTYAADTGYVTMYVDSFSPFTAVYDMPVAAIGTTVYYTLQAAVNAAQANETVVLIKDVSLNTKLNISGKKITLDGAGYTISASADFTPKDSMIGVTAYNDNAGFVMKNVTLTGNDKTKYTLNLFKATDFVLENVISSANNFGSLLINSSTGTIKGKATNIPALEVYTNKASSSLPSDLTVMDGTYMYAKVYTEDTTSAPAKLTITGGTFTGCVNASVNGTISITGGTFSADPKAYVAEGYKAVDNGNGTWTVRSKSLDDYFAGGSGTAEDPYQVNGAEQFKSIVSGTQENIMYYKLTNDIYFDEAQEILKDSTDNYSESYLLYLDNVCLDGGAHIVTSYNHSYGDHLPFIIYKTSGNTTIKNLTVSNGNPIIRKVEGTLTLENVKTIGTVSGSDNNMCARYLQKPESSNSVTINFINCDNESNIIGSGYVGVYVGTINNMKGGTLSLNFENCDNSGSLISTGSSSSMLIANPTNYQAANFSGVITISNCTNTGKILCTNNSVSTLLMSCMSDSGVSNFTVNGTPLTEQTSNSTERQTLINKALGDTLTGTQPEIVENKGKITTNNGCFVLPNTAEAVRYELMFSFTGLNGANAGYKMVLGNTLPTNIKVGSWVALKDVASGATVTEHPQTGELPYYTTGEGESLRYVYNVSNASIRSKVTAMLIAYDSTDNMLSVATYQYS